MNKQDNTTDASERMGKAFFWCPFCFAEWEEDYLEGRAFYSYRICTDCQVQGHTTLELTPRFWRKLRKDFKTHPRAIPPTPKQKKLDQFIW